MNKKREIYTKETKCIYCNKTGFDSKYWGDNQSSFIEMMVDLDKTSRCINVICLECEHKSRTTVKLSDISWQKTDMDIPDAIVTGTIYFYGKRHEHSIHLGKPEDVTPKELKEAKQTICDVLKEIGANHVNPYQRASTG